MSTLEIFWLCGIHLRFGALLQNKHVRKYLLFLEIKYVANHYYLNI